MATYTAPLPQLHLVLNKGDTLNVQDHGLAYDTRINGGVENVYAGGTDVGTTINSGGENASKQGYLKMTLSFLECHVRSSYSVFKFLGVLTVSLLVGVLSSDTAWAQTPEPSANTPQSAPAQPNAQTLSDEQRETFRKKMIRTPPRRSGCFEARYPNGEWEGVPRLPPPKPPSPLARRQRPAVIVGYGNDYFAEVTGNNISSATGSFDSATGIMAVYSQIYQDNTKTVYPNTYTLQLNANKFSIPGGTACVSGSQCGWQQFLFSQHSACAGSPCVYIEYWLFDSPNCPSDGTLGKGCSCPSSAAWISYYDPSGKTASGCYINTPGKGGFSTPTCRAIQLVLLTYHKAGLVLNLTSLATVVLMRHS